MKVIDTAIADIKILEPQVFKDERGFFLESYNEKTLNESLKIKMGFVQDNHSFSVKGTLRGLHYQITQAQGKLVRVVTGEVFDVAVDLRKSSPTFGKWVGFILSAQNKRLAWIPPGFAHGFLTLTESADFLYKCTEYYAPEHDRCLLWNDPALKIEWPLEQAPLLSAKDAKGKKLVDAETYP